mgnify:CR=1 FL=1
MNAQDFTVKRDDLSQTKVVQKNYPDELMPGQVLLAIDRFSFTSNNITYGVVGERMSYWSFFPAEQGYGIIPAWGYATVIVSSHPDVAVGQRFYGYYPMSSHLLVTPGRVSSMGFTDQTKHRKTLPSVYNFYSSTANDPSYSPDTEELTALFKPLFVTSFLIDDQLAEEHFYGASQIVLTSASSKTAQALACLLANRKKQDGLKINIIGLTSERNKGFVHQLGWYDQIVSYEELAELNQKEDFVIVDFTGNHQLQFQLQTLLEDRLQYNCLVGLVDWHHLKGDQPLPKKGEFFFAPTNAEKRQKDWGVSGFHQRVGIAWHHFVHSVQSNLVIEQHNGAEELQILYADMLQGKVDSKCGNIVSLK